MRPLSSSAKPVASRLRSGYYFSVPAGNSEQRKLAAIMFTDMVGYSALAQRDEKLALELLAEHHRLLRPIFPQFSGREIKSTGDGFLVEFASALAATQCAIEIQRALVQHNAAAPAERRIHIRIGVHVGDVVLREADMFGDGVNIAARIEPLAEAGGICLSRPVVDQIANKIDSPLVKLGTPELKNIQMPLEVYRVVLPWHGDKAKDERQKENESAAASTRRGAFIAVLVIVALNLFLFLKFGLRFGEKNSPTTNHPTAASVSTNNASIALPAPVAAPAAEQKSIAVLPFKNMSADKENEYFSDGLTEQMTSTLSQVKGLDVRGRTSAFVFKEKQENLREVGRQLNAAFLLEGSVQKAGSQVRINVQLIEASADRHLWATNYDRDLTNIFAIQSEITARVAEVLKVKLGVEEAQNIAKKPTENLEAYDLYLRGREFWNKRTGADLQRAIGYFQQATEKDPKFAAAFAGLASSYAVLPDYSSLPVRETNPKAQAAARKALELDSQLAEAHAVLGFCAVKDWDIAGAQQEYEAALRLNPNYATSYHWYSKLLRDLLGRVEEALAVIRKAQSLDPLSPVIQRDIGDTLLFAHRYDEALIEVEKALRLSPDFLSAHIVHGRILLVQKRITEAVVDFEKVWKKTGDDPYALGYLGHSYARAGRINEARAILEKLKNALAAGKAASFDIAYVYQGLGDLDQAFAWLERAIESHELDPRSLKYDPAFGDFVSDPRYAALLKKFGLDK